MSAAEYGAPMQRPGEPLRVTCTLVSPVKMPACGYIALDSLLAAAVAMVEGAPPLIDTEEPVVIRIPVETAPGGAFHLASVSTGEVVAYSQTWRNRRFPLSEAQGLGEAKLTRVNIGVGRTKTVRKPVELAHMREGKLTWYCVGDRERIAALLKHIRHVGGDRGSGKGAVRPDGWRVVPCDPWPGFPVVLDGAPLRNLPLDWPGVVTGRRAVERLTYPYQTRAGRAECWAPSVGGD